MGWLNPGTVIERLWPMKLGQVLLLVEVLLIVAALSLGIMLYVWSAVSKPKTVEETVTTPTPQSSGNVTQNIYGNSGTIIGSLTIQGAPDLTPKLSNVSQVKLADGTYQYSALISINTPYQLAQIRFIARAVSIKSINVRPQGSGFYGRAEGYFSEDHSPFIEFRNVAGPFEVTAVTENQDAVTIVVQQ